MTQVIINKRTDRRIKTDVNLLNLKVLRLEKSCGIFEKLRRQKYYEIHFD